ncbi:hypothetical protein BN946_scf184325.g2 [Trametes cinnabarina]|uniref:XPG-I domain-containing protein n=1 Tax=Pycnoporus cinnabarinus TaxID=5643 RepID=A0A060SJM5_PYCCI|nr:hypothetical protein BN946_scf184325.g2 [Trametes cinnabarina]
MGVKSLWTLLESRGATEKKFLRTHAIADGFEGTRRDRLYHLGVDVSIWVQQLQQVFVKGHAQAGENPELRHFYYRLAMLAERPLHVVFVADGPARPAVKRKKQVKTNPHWLLEGMQSLAEAFGYSWLQAAGEAEAELAQMNKLGIIDAVLTEDSDALLFGARVVIRKSVPPSMVCPINGLTVASSPSFKRTDPDIVTICRADDVLNVAGLAPADLLLLALLLGSDYDPAGLSGCGPVVAYGLAKYGLGRSLHDALCSMSEDKLSAFLPAWRAQLRDSLRVDPQGHIGRRHAALAASVPATFPDVAVARLFLDPPLLCADQYALLGDARPVDLPRLGQLCERYFQWGSCAELLKTFRKTLWVGEAVHMLIRDGLQAKM